MKRTYKEVKPEEIIATDETVQPSRALVENIKINGIIEPLLVSPVYKRSDELMGYNVLSGLRRFNAFQIARRELEEVAQMNPEARIYQKYARQIETMKEKLSRLPVVIFEDAAEEIVLIGNSLRTKNPLHELSAIESIHERMMGQMPQPSVRDIEKEITRATGMTAATQRNRMRLKNLIHDLRVMLAAGRMSASVADGAARLPVKLQKRLLKMLGEKEETMGDRATITANDLREVQSVNVRQATQSLFANLDMSTPAAAKD
jgi:hypothetical protein